MSRKESFPLALVIGGMLLLMVVLAPKQRPRPLAPPPIVDEPHRAPVQPADPQVNPAAPDQAKPVAGPELPPGQKLFGYNPHPEATREFVRSLPKPHYNDWKAAEPPAVRGPPEVGDDAKKEPVLLYRALYAAAPGWTVGAQGIGDCFPPGTMVLMEDGTQKPIEQVKVGDSVYTHTGAVRIVEGTISKRYSGLLVEVTTDKLACSVEATPDHLIFCDDLGENAWTPIHDLRINQRAWVGQHRHKGYSERDAVVRMRRRDVKELTVYCLAVEADNSFVANGFVVHNCVSWGWAHGVDVLSAVEYKLGVNGVWKPVATEPIYGGSRVQARGVSQGGWSDGSYGGAAAKWVRDWGVLYREAYPSVDLSKYDARRAKQYGNYGCPKDLEGAAKEHPVKTVALVTNFNEAADAISNGYPVPVCSGQGFSSQRDKDGFAAPQGSWPHCMCFWGVRFDRPGLLCMNSWAIWNHGPLVPSDQPPGSFWVDASVVNRMLAGRDSFAISSYVGFPPRQLRHAEGWGFNLPPRPAVLVAQDRRDWFRKIAGLNGDGGELELAGRLR